VLPEAGELALDHFPGSDRLDASWKLALAGCLCGFLLGCGGASTANPLGTPVQGSVPAAVTGLFVNAAPDAGGDPTKAAAYLGWVASTGPNVTGYVVNYSVNGGATASANVTATAYSLAGLAAGGSLSVTVTAQNVAGNSAATAAVLTTLPSSPTTAQNAAYASAAAYSDSQSGLAVVIFKNGQTVYTHYSNGYADTPQPLASGTKSFNCAFEIFAQQDGYLTLDDNASKVITEWGSNTNESQITLQDLLSLQSGLSGNAGYSPLNATNLDTYQQAKRSSTIHSRFRTSR
jgi:hypothetical protein